MYKILALVSKFNAGDNSVKDPLHNFFGDDNAIVSEQSPTISSEHKYLKDDPSFSFEVIDCTDEDFIDDFELFSFEELNDPSSLDQENKPHREPELRTDFMTDDEALAAAIALSRQTTPPTPSPQNPLEAIPYCEASMSTLQNPYYTNSYEDDLAKAIQESLKLANKYSKK